MSKWESVPCERPGDKVALNPNTLEVPQSFVEFANPKGMPYCTISVDSASYRLGIRFHEDSGDKAAQLIRACGTGNAGGGEQTVSLRCRHLRGSYSWLDAIANAPAKALRVFPLTHSASDGLWVSELPYPLNQTVTDGKYSSSLPVGEGVLCFFEGEAAIGVTVGPISRYLHTPKVLKSFWTTCNCEVVPDNSRRTATANWWREFFQLKQNAPLRLQSGRNLRWRGNCRNESEILMDQGWSEEAIERLIYDAYRDSGLDPHKVRSVAEQLAELDEGIERAALRSQLTPLEICEAEKRLYYRSSDEDDDSDRRIDGLADSYLADEGETD